MFFDPTLYGATLPHKEFTFPFTPYGKELGVPFAPPQIPFMQQQFPFVPPQLPYMQQQFPFVPPQLPYMQQQPPFVPPQLPYMQQQFQQFPWQNLQRFAPPFGQTPFPQFYGYTPFMPYGWQRPLTY